MSVNKVTLLGRVTKNPEIKNFDNGSLVTLTIVTGKKHTDPLTGEKKVKSQFHRVVCKKSVANYVSLYVKKGTLLYCEGYLNNTSWKNNEGKTQYSYEIVIDATGNIEIINNGISRNDTNNFRNQVNC
ncbi:single-stranded DNA-binding protein [Rosenbergiella collisarenosi]|uniref:single-stranded DNA-binding protein n=1 Tax=Rosenbergiella collisarenosi TaxID=1544695 RepID=UPI001F4DA42B|nr:single-stranded DNA-binding protein [Rosenbergiella collisarenosi]